MAEADKRNTAWINTAKGLCILMVVLNHVIITAPAIPAEVSGPAAQLFQRVHQLIGLYLAPLRMPLFFMISGFLAQRSVKASDWASVRHPRIFNIAYVYLLWGGIQWAGVSAIWMMADQARPSDGAANAIYADELIDYVRLTLTGSSSLWYLYALPIYFVICKVLSRHRWPAIAVLLGLHFIAKFYVTQWPQSSVLGNAIYYGVGAFFGAWLFDALSRLDWRSARLVALALVLALVMAAAGLVKSIALSFLFVSVIILALAWVHRRFKFHALQWIGKNTLQIYILHRIFLELIDVFLSGLIGDGLLATATLAALWSLLYPTAATTTIVAACLLVWRLTRSGAGQYLYRAPRANELEGWFARARLLAGSGRA